MIPLLYLDFPTNRSYGFQDPASNTMYGIKDLHDSILFYLIILLVLVCWLLFSTFFNPDHLPFLRHGNAIEIVRTISPALILWFIAIPSLKLLYLLDEILDPDLTVKAIGHSWYWSYEYTDYVHLGKEPLAFDSFLVPDSDLLPGQLRRLTVDSYLILPIHTSIRLLITSKDVIHSFAVPSLGLKADAIPGRLNSLGFIINRPGTFYGQCSELCGDLHSAKPIGIQAVNLPAYLSYLQNS